MTNQMDRVYWAAKPAEDLAGEMFDRIDRFYDFLNDTGQASLYNKCYYAYYRALESGGQLNTLGASAEYIQLFVNHFRSIISTILNLIGAQEIKFEAQAVNNDQRSLEQTKLAQGLLDYYLIEKQVGRRIKSALEAALLFTEAFMLTEWDVEGGEVYSTHPETGAPIYNGDIKPQTLMPFQVIRDVYKTDSLSDDWFIVRTYENKFKLAANLQNFQPVDEENKRNVDEDIDKILGAGRDQERMKNILFFPSTWMGEDDSLSDDVAVYTLYHKPTPALPQGRLVQVLSNDFIYYDGPIPYKQIPVRRISAGDMLYTGFSYSVGQDILSIQEMVDLLYSTIATNQGNFGVQNIASPRQANVSVDQLPGGVNLVKYDGNTPPTPMNLLNTSPEIFNHLDRVERVIGTLSGMNATVRGIDETKGAESGSALALKASQAIQAVSTLETSYVNLVRDVGGDIIRILRDFAKTPRVALIVGQNNQAYLKEFQGDDIDQIERVHVNVGSAASGTKSGRLTIADSLLQKGILKDATEYFTVLETGRLDRLYEGEFNELILIQGENEMLSRGEKPVVRMEDLHTLHIMEHRAVAGNPVVRQNEEYMGALDMHISEHLQALRNIDPILAGILGQPVIPPPMPVPMGAAGEVTDVMNSAPPAETQAGQVNEPRMPKAPPGTPPEMASIVESMPAPV